MIFEPKKIATGFNIPDSDYVVATARCHESITLWYSKKCDVFLMAPVGVDESSSCGLSLFDQTK